MATVFIPVITNDIRCNGSRCLIIPSRIVAIFPSVNQYRIVHVQVGFAKIGIFQFVDLAWCQNTALQQTYENRSRIHADGHFCSFISIEYRRLRWHTDINSHIELPAILVNQSIDDLLGKTLGSYAILEKGDIICSQLMFFGKSIQARQLFSSHIRRLQHDEISPINDSIQAITLCQLKSLDIPTIRFIQLNHLESFQLRVGFHFFNHTILF